MMNAISPMGKNTFFQSRSMIWITKNAPLQWKFSQSNTGSSHLVDYVTGEQLFEAV